MNKLYNTQSEIANKIREYLKKKCNKFTKNTVEYYTRNSFWYDFC